MFSLPFFFSCVTHPPTSLPDKLVLLLLRSSRGHRCWLDAGQRSASSENRSWGFPASFFCSDLNVYAVSVFCFTSCFLRTDRHWWNHSALFFVLSLFQLLLYFIDLQLGIFLQYNQSSAVSTHINVDFGINYFSRVFIFSMFTNKVVNISWCNNFCMLVSLSWTK